MFRNINVYSNEKNTDTGGSVMKIVYLNTNGFYGIDGCNKNSKNESNINNAREILTLLFENVDPNIIFFSEFDVNSCAGQFVIKKLKEKGYFCVFPNQFKYMSEHYTSIVIAFTKEKKQSEKSPTKKSLKWNEIRLNDYRIVGVHIPDSINDTTEAVSYWQSLIKHYEMYKNEKIIYIGDMNVFEHGTVGKQYFNTILKNARDAWLENGNSNSNKEDVTFVKGNTRIDYVLLSQNILEKYNITNVQDIFINMWSDHSALILEF